MAGINDLSYNGSIFRYFVANTDPELPSQSHWNGHEQGECENPSPPQQSLHVGGHGASSPLGPPWGC